MYGIILFIANGFEPFVRGARLILGMNRQVLHPRVRSGSVPVFDAFGDSNHRSRSKRNSGLVPFLIPTLTAHADQHLNRSVVNMPVIAATRFERHIRHTAEIRLQETLAHEILCIGGIGFAFGPDGEVHRLHRDVRIAQDRPQRLSQALRFGKADVVFQQRREFPEFGIRYSHVPGPGDMGHELGPAAGQGRIAECLGSCCRDCWSINQFSMPVYEDMISYAKKNWEEYGDKIDISTSENPIPETRFWTMGDSLYFGIPRLTSVCLVFCFTKDTEYSIPSFVTNVKRDAFTSCKNLRTLRLSPYIKASDDPWESKTISYDFIYENWTQIEDIIFDETLKHSKYAFGLIA